MLFIILLIQYAIFSLGTIKSFKYYLYIYNIFSF